MNKEEVYDAEIAPLMAKVIDICKAHKIAMLASFHIPTEEDEDLACTTALLLPDFNPPPRMVQALDLIYPPSPPMLMLTTRDAAGNVTRMDAIV